MGVHEPGELILPDVSPTGSSQGLHKVSPAPQGGITLNRQDHRIAKVSLCHCEAVLHIAALALDERTARGTQRRQCMCELLHDTPQLTKRPRDIAARGVAEAAR